MAILGVVKGDTSVKKAEAELVKNVRSYFANNSLKYVNSNQNNVNALPKASPLSSSSGARAVLLGGNVPTSVPSIKVKRLKFSKQIHQKAKKTDYYLN